MYTRYSGLSFHLLRALSKKRFADCTPLESVPLASVDSHWGSGVPLLPFVTWLLSTSLNLQPRSPDSRPGLCDPNVTHTSLVPRSDPETAKPPPDHKASLHLLKSTVGLPYLSLASTSKVSVEKGQQPESRRSDSLASSWNQ